MLCADRKGVDKYFLDFSVIFVFVFDVVHRQKRCLKISTSELFVEFKYKIQKAIQIQNCCVQTEDVSKNIHMRAFCWAAPSFVVDWLHNWCKIEMTLKKGLERFERQKRLALVEHERSVSLGLHSHVQKMSDALQSKYLYASCSGPFPILRTCWKHSHCQFSRMYFIEVKNVFFSKWDWMSTLLPSFQNSMHIVSTYMYLSLTLAKCVAFLENQKFESFYLDQFWTKWERNGD